MGGAAARLGATHPNIVSPTSTDGIAARARVKGSQAFAAPAAILDPVHIGCGPPLASCTAAARGQVDSDLAAERARLGKP